MSFYDALAYTLPSSSAIGAPHPLTTRVIDVVLWPYARIVGDDGVAILFHKLLVEEVKARFHSRIV